MRGKKTRGRGVRRHAKLEFWEGWVMGPPAAEGRYAKTRKVAAGEDDQRVSP